MADSSNQITPKTTVAIASQQTMSDSQRLVLDRLYQPILGVSAYSLVTTFWRDVATQPLLRVEVTHAQLLARLNMDLPTLQSARERLEALGLMRSFRRQDDALPEWLYQLVPPVPSTVFFGDNLLSLLLLEIIGEQPFQELALQFRDQPINHNSFEETTKHFLDVFKVDNRLVATPPTVVQDVRRQLGSGEQSLKPEAIRTVTSGFDFELLTAILERSYVDLDDLAKHRELLLGEVALYGLTEPEMATYVNDATNLVTNQLDVQRLKLAIASDHRKSSPKTVASKEPESGSQVVETLNDKEQVLLKIANQTAPMTFLTKLRAEKGGYVSSGEQRIIEHLANQQIFGQPVINILIFYLLNDMRQATITQRLTDTIANSWAQAGVKTAADALKEIHRYRQERDAGGTTKRPGKKSRQVKETLPDWAKDDYQPTNQVAALTAEQRAKMAAQLKRLNAKKGEDNSGEH